MFAAIVHHLLWQQRRVAAARAWRDAERAGLDGEEPSLMRQLLAGAVTDEEMDELEIAPGVWLLPGAPP